MSISLGLLLVLPLWAETPYTVLNQLGPNADGLTVQKVVELALEHSPRVTKTEAQHQGAEALAKTAFIGFVPRLDGLAQYARLSFIDLPPQIAPIFPLVQDTFAFQASVSVPLSEYFLTLIHLYDATLKGEELARYRAKAEKQAVAMDAIERFLALVQAKAVMVVAEHSVSVFEKQLFDTKKLKEAGFLTHGDVLQLQARFEAAKVAQEQANMQNAVAEEALRLLLHSHEGPLTPSEDLFVEAEVVLPEREDAVSQALARRFELQALRTVVGIQKDQVAYQFGKIWPRLTLDGMAVHSRPNQRTFFDAQNFNTTWQAGASLRWSPTDAVVAYSERRKARVEVVAAKADLEALEQNIQLEVQTAILGVKSLSVSIVAARDAVVAAHGAFVDRQKLLAAGQGSTRELLLAEQDFRQAQLQLINAYLNLRLARARLERATGSLLKGES